jgi:N-acetylglucosaminyl-diphospho-decaprenol L-rhamnosyltransferase
VVHLVGQSSGLGGRAPDDAARKRMPAYWFRSRRRYFLAHLGPSRAFLADLAWALGFLSFRVRQFVQRKPDVDPPMFLRDFVRHRFLGIDR